VLLEILVGAPQAIWIRGRLNPGATRGPFLSGRKTCSSTLLEWRQFGEMWEEDLFLGGSHTTRGTSAPIIFFWRKSGRFSKERVFPHTPLFLCVTSYILGGKSPFFGKCLDTPRGWFITTPHLYLQGEGFVPPPSGDHKKAFLNIFPPPPIKHWGGTTTT